MATRPTRARLRRGSTLVGLALGVVAAATLAPATPASANGNCVTYWGPDGLWSGAPAAGGTGTSADPYLVGSATDLSELRFCLDRHFRQVADVTLTGDWSPIGTGSPFSGVYRGDGHAIDGLTVNLPGDDSVGLFATTAGAVIADVTLASATVTGATGTGVLVGSARGTVVRNVAVTATVTGQERVGVLVGSAQASTFARIAGSGSVTGSGNAVGGVLGSSEKSTTSKASFEGTVTTPGDFVGGLVGGADGSRIEDAAVTATVTGGYMTGGIVGILQPNSTVVRASSDSDVTGENAVGGITGGGEYGSVSDVAVTGAVRGEDQVGGVVGQSFLVAVKDAVSSAAVAGAADVGGAGGQVIGDVTTSPPAVPSRPPTPRSAGWSGTRSSARSAAPWPPAASRPVANGRPAGWSVKARSWWRSSTATPLALSPTREPPRTPRRTAPADWSGVPAEPSSGARRRRGR